MNLSSEKTKTRSEKMKMWGLRDPRQPNTFKLFFLPFQLYRYPGMVFAGILVGGILSWYNVVGGSLALILSNAPYNFSTNTIGLTYLACFIGVSIGCFLSGWLSDIVTLKLARRNGGIMEPEHRLYMCVVAIIAHPAGCLLYGVGASYSIHWVGIVFGLGLISVTLPIGSSLALTYILDSYKEMAGEGLVSAILIRNLMGKFSGQAKYSKLTSIRLCFQLRCRSYHHQSRSSKFLYSDCHLGDGVLVLLHVHDHLRQISSASVGSFVLEAS